MDLIDKEIIQDCIRSGEKLKRELETYAGTQGQDEDWLNELIGRWWEEVLSKLRTIETIFVENSVFCTFRDPIKEIQAKIDYLNSIEKDSKPLWIPEVFFRIPSRVTAKDSLRLVYAKSRIYDADDPTKELRLKKGFKSDLLALCFENPARPLRIIPFYLLEKINPEYTHKKVTKKDGYLENLREHWATQFRVEKKVIKEMIRIDNQLGGHYILISENIDVEFSKKKSSKK